MSKRAIRKAMHVADAEIAGHARRDSLYARGLAGEGYSGGYRDALQDVLLLLSGVVPQRRNYWSHLREEPQMRPKEGST